MSAYSYTKTYKPGKDHGNTDSLSWLPIPDAPSVVPLPGEVVLLMEALQNAQVSAQQIKLWTDRDPKSGTSCCKVDGWLTEKDPDLRPYQTRKDELSIQDGCVLWGSRVVVPPSGRSRVMEELHESHPGIARMKALARRFVWWPGMDAELEQKVKSCKQCQANQKAPPLAPLHQWEWSEHPWSRGHVDYTGPFMGRMFLQWQR